MIIEKLASYAHKAWSGWLQYMFSKSTKNEDGSVTIPASLVERWTRQMNTPYEQLPESEKLSDKAEANDILEIIKREEKSYPAIDEFNQRLNDALEKKS